MSKQRAIAKAEALGLTINEDDLRFGLEAPRGHHFEGGLHELCYDVSDGIKDSWSGRTVWQEMLQDMREQGFEPCTDQCEW